MLTSLLFSFFFFCFSFGTSPVGTRLSHRTLPPACQQQQCRASINVFADLHFNRRSRHAEEVPVPTVPLLDQHHDQPATPRARAFGRAPVQVLRLWQGLHPENPDDQAQLHRPDAWRHRAHIRGVANGASAFVAGTTGKLALQLL